MSRSSTGTCSRVAEWIRSGLATTAAQTLIQALGLTAGIVIIRDLTPAQYAFYTIASAGLGTMTVLADGGVGNSLFALGGADWQNRNKLGAVIASGLYLRRRFAFVAVAIAVPVMIWLLHRQGADWTEAALIAFSVVPLFLATVTGHLLEAVPRLHQQLAPLQLVQVWSNAIRVVLTAAILPFLPLAALGSLIAAAPQWWANLRLRKIAGRHAEWRKPPEPVLVRRIAAQVRRTMPAVAYYAISGQLTIWLISLFGKNSDVAAIGALSRLAMMLAILTSVFNTLAVPRFARIQACDSGRLRRRYFQSQLALASVCAVPLMFLAVFPQVALAVLGPHYVGLNREVFLMGTSSVAAVLCGAAYTLGAARGVVAPPWVSVPFTFLGQLVLVLVLPIDTISGVIWIGVLSALAQWVFHIGYFLFSQRAGTF